MPILGTEQRIPQIFEISSTEDRGTLGANSFPELPIYFFARNYYILNIKSTFREIITELWNNRRNGLQKFLRILLLPHIEHMRIH